MTFLTRWGRLFGHAWMASACLGSQASAGAWQQENGRWLTISALEYFQASEDDRSFEQLSTRVYTEWAAAPGLTLGGKTSRAQQVSETPTQVTAASGINEAQLFASWHRVADGRAWAWRLSGHLETEKFARDVRVAGQDAAIGFAGVTGWGGEGWFFEVDLEERWSLGIDADQLRMQTTAGKNVGPALLLAQTVVTESHTQTAAGGLNFDLGQASLSAIVDVTQKYALEFGGRHDLYGENIDKGSSVFVSIWYRP